MKSLFSFLLILATVTGLAQTPPWQCPLAANTPAGTLDSCFQWNIQTSVDTVVTSVTILPDQKLLCFSPVKRFMPLRNRGPLFRLNPDGTLDSTFSTASLPDSTYQILGPHLVLSSGKILVALTYGVVGNSSTGTVIRLNQDGSFDSTYHWAGLGGTPPNGFVITSIHESPTGIVWVGRAYIDKIYDPFNADGSANTTATEMEGLILAFKPDGKIITASNYYPANPSVIGIDERNANGTVVRGLYSFSRPNHVTIESGTVLPNGKILYTRYFQGTSYYTMVGLYSLLANGTPDTSFQEGAIPTDNDITISNIVPQADGKLWVANGGHLYRLNANGSIDTTLHLGTAGPNAIKLMLNRTADGHMLISGDFTQYKGRPAAYLAKIIMGNGTVTAAASPQLSPIVLVPNPATSTIALQTPALGPVSVFNAQGALVLSERKTSREPAYISVSPLPAGLYTVRIGVSQARFVKK